MLVWDNSGVSIDYMDGSYVYEFIQGTNDLDEVILNHLGISEKHFGYLCSTYIGECDLESFEMLLSKLGEGEEFVNLCEKQNLCPIQFEQIANAVQHSEEVAIIEDYTESKTRVSKYVIENHKLFLIQVGSTDFENKVLLYAGPVENILKYFYISNDFINDKRGITNQ